MNEYPRKIVAKCIEDPRDRTDQLHCPECGIPTIRYRTGLTDEDALCDACAKSIAYEDNHENPD
jgi:formylmethanofuran dehydrogenase subunit E